MDVDRKAAFLEVFGVIQFIQLQMNEKVHALLTARLPFNEICKQYESKQILVKCILNY